MNPRKALLVTLGWVIMALIFNAGIYYYQGSAKALEFLTSYLVELSLSVDNVFVFLLIFTYFKVEGKEQTRILFWGVLGAQVMRLVFILLGVALLNKYHWLIYIFGTFLVITGFKLFFEKDKDNDLDKNPVIKFTKKFFPHLSKFWIVLIVIETTDLIFALDSIPAVLSITKDPFIAFMSNFFAILGLRAMYFALAGLMGMFHFLHYALGAILVFVGFKMLSEHYIHVPIGVTLGFIGSSLTLAIIASMLNPAPKKKA